MIFTSQRKYNATEIQYSFEIFCANSFYASVSGTCSGYQIYFHQGGSGENIIC